MILRALQPQPLGRIQRHQRIKALAAHRLFRRLTIDPADVDQRAVSVTLALRTSLALHKVPRPEIEPPDLGDGNVHIPAAWQAVFSAQESIAIRLNLEDALAVGIVPHRRSDGRILRYFPTNRRSGQIHRLGTARGRKRIRPAHARTLRQRKGIKIAAARTLRLAHRCSRPVFRAPFRFHPARTLILRLTKLRLFTAECGEIPLRRRGILLCPNPPSALRKRAWLLSESLDKCPRRALFTRHGHRLSLPAIARMAYALLCGVHRGFPSAPAIQLCVAAFLPHLSGVSRDRLRVSGVSPLRSCGILRPRMLPGLFLSCRALSRLECSAFASRNDLFSQRLFAGIRRVLLRRIFLRIHRPARSRRRVCVEDDTLHLSWRSCAMTGILYAYFIGCNICGRRNFLACILLDSGAPGF